MRSIHLLALSLLAALTACAGADTPTEGDAGSGGDCVPGARRCEGNAAQVCTGGGFWSLPQNCGAASCVEGSCQASCDASCMVGTTRCAPEGLQRCVAGGDGCGVWSAPETCLEGTRCVEGQCTAETCEAQCSPGARRCVGPSAYTECANEECPRWQPAQDCIEGQVCSAGDCTDDGGGECQDECAAGERVCLGADQVQRCERQDTGCLDFSPAETCPEGRRCAPGEGCVATCGAPECSVGEVRCFQGGVQRCVETPEDGCVVWGAVIACDDGAQCRAGACEAVCIPECVVGEQRCVEGGRQTCQRIDDCERWGAAEACPGGTQCQGAGMCGVCANGQEETRPCGRCGSQGRRCNNGSWGNWGACGGEGICDAGAREACGNCGTRTCNAQCQWGGCEGGGVCAPGETTAMGTCGQCGWRTCNQQCQWNAACARDGSDWQRCGDCGWQFCCPDANWCNCAPNFSCGGGQSCVGAGVCQ